MQRFEKEIKAVYRHDAQWAASSHLGSLCAGRDWV